MFRWRYIIPRVIIFGLIICIVAFASGPLTKWLLITGGQSVTGAKVEIGNLETSWLEGKIRMGEIEIADPRHPMNNLVQQDEAVLNLDVDRLLHKEFIVEQARISNIQFGTPRTDSGLLSKSNKPSHVDLDWIINPLKKQAKTLGQNWLEQFERRSLKVIEDKLETVRVARQLNEQWTARYRYHHEQANKIKKQIDELKSMIKKPSKNPLRDFERLQVAMRQINNFHNQLRTTRREIHQLDDLLKRDRQRLIDAKERDQQKIKSSAEFFKVDANTTSELLLGRQRSDYVNEVISWVKWFRGVLPNPKRDFYPQRSRGENIQFVGLKPRPKFLIQSAKITGRGNIGGQRHDFFGSATNLSTQPEFVEAPTVFNLETSGARRIQVVAQLDRRTDKKIDDIRIKIPGIRIPAKHLGSPDSMLLDVSEGRLVADIGVRVEDNNLVGRIVFRQDHLKMSVRQLNPKAGGFNLASSINQQLSQLNEFVVQIDFSGKPNNLNVKLQSDLGTKISDAFGRMVNQAAAETIAVQTRRLEEQVNEEIARLTNRHKTEINKLLKIVNADSNVVAGLEKIIPNLNKWPKIR